MAAFMQQLNLESPGWKIWILDAGSNQQGTFVVRLEYLDKQLCRSLHIPERAMMEGQHGTLAEAEAHADVIFTIQDIEHRRVTAELNRQAVDQVLRLNFGEKAAGKVRLKASPIVDEKKAYFKQIYAQLLASPAGQRELQSLDAGSLREQLGLPQVQNDPGDVEHLTQEANLQAIPGLSAGTPGGSGKAMMAQGPDGRPVTVPGETENPAAALANAIWGMRNAIALSSTALEKAAALYAGGDSLKLAGNEPVQQEPWQEHPDYLQGELGYKTKTVPLGDDDYLRFEALSSREGEDPDLEEVRAAHGLEYPHEVIWTRGPEDSEAFGGRTDITGQGQAGAMLSHAAHALRELVHRYKPVSVEFSAAADEPSRQKAYHHMMRRLVKENVGNGEYVFLHEPPVETERDWGVYGKPAYFHLVHKAAADLPRYEGMERIGAGEPVAAAGETMADVLGARPIDGRLAEDMNTVAMANAQDWQEKTIAPALDAPERVQQYLSPGMAILAGLRARRAGRQAASPGHRILQELRARRGYGGRGWGFANDPPQPESPSTMPQPASAPVEYLGHGPTAEGDYGIKFRTPQGEEQHLALAKLRPIENEHAGDRMMEATFHNGSAVNMRMPEEHRKQIIGQLLAQARVRSTQPQQFPLTRDDIIAQKEARRRAERDAEATRRPKPTKGKVDTGGMHLEMPAIPYVGTGETRRVAESAPDVISEHFRNDIVPQLISRFSDRPDLHATIRESGDFGAGKTIASTWHSTAARAKNAEQTKGRNILNAVPLVYNAVLQELPGWDPRTQTETDAQGRQVPLTLPRFLMRVASKYFARLTREPEPTEIPDTDVGKGTDSEGERRASLDPSERGEASMLGESKAAEEEQRFKLASLWMSPHLDKAGMEVFQQQKADPDLKQLRSKYGDEVVDDRLNQINQLTPYFTAWLEGDYSLPEEAYQFMPKASAVKAKNILPIKRTAYGPEKVFLNRFGKGLSPQEAEAAKLIYYARRQGTTRMDELVGHEELPEGFQTQTRNKLERISARMTKAAKQFDQENGTNISKKIGKRFKSQRERQVYVEEPEHHTGLEEFIRDKLSQENAKAPLMKILTQAMLGTVPVSRLESDPELANLAAQRYQELRKIGSKKATREPEGAYKLVHNYHRKFKNWIPEYFESIGEPKLAEKYRLKNAKRAESAIKSAKVRRGELPPQSADEREGNRRETEKKSRKQQREARMQKRQVIDPATLNLDAVEKAFRAAFGEGSTRTDPWRVPEVPRDKLGMMLLISKLEHQSLKKFLAETGRAGDRQSAWIQSRIRKATDGRKQGKGPEAVVGQERHAHHQASGSGPARIVA